MRKELFLKGTKEIRRKPANFLISDKYLFEREFTRIYEDIDSIKFKQAYYYKGDFYDYRLKNLSLIFLSHNLTYIRTYFKQIKNRINKLDFFQYLKLFFKNIYLIKLHFLKYIFLKFRSIIKLLKMHRKNDLNSIKIEKGALLTANWSWTNYFHWNHDFLPLILFYYESNKEDNNIVIPITFLKKAPFVQETLKILGIKYTILDNKSKYFFANLDIIDARLNPGNQRAHLITNLRDKFYKAYDYKLKEPQEIIYISRRDNSKIANTNIRNISNEEECIKLFKKFKIRVISTLGLSITKQFNIFSNCKALIAIHGAGLTNMIFMQSGTNILEIRQIDDSGSNCYFSMASALKHNYYYLNAENIKNTDVMNASLSVDLNLLEKKLIEILN